MDKINKAIDAYQAAERAAYEAMMAELAAIAGDNATALRVEIAASDAANELFRRGIIKRSQLNQTAEDILDTLRGSGHVILN